MNGMDEPIQKGMSQNYTDILIDSLIDYTRKETAKEFAEKLKIKAIRLSELENYHVCNLIDELLKEYEK